ncbi:MAG: response regulator [Oscillospiraceae bacterium]|jgi:CheY-like chemotaxis protein|nr:response regulator [Oscillospiraceae bacterium]
MLKKENLLSVSELKGASKINAMSEGQFENYCRSVNTFIDSFPAQADKLRTASDEQNFKNAEKILSEICAILETIFASGLAADAKKQIHALQKGDTDPSTLEAFIEKFILNTSSLSIDIQMAARKKSTAPSPQVRQIFSAGSSGGGPVILAVDNAIMFLNTLKKLLQGTHYDLHCVSSANDALDFVNKGNRVDLFLLDIEMPGMDGYELARRLKGQGQGAPVVFVTANSAREYVDKAIAVGAEGLLMKPLRSHQLLSKVKEFV